MSANGTVCPTTGEFYALPVQPFRYRGLPDLPGSCKRGYHFSTQTKSSDSGQRKLASGQSDKLGTIRTGLSSSLFPGPHTDRRTSLIVAQQGLELAMIIMDYETEEDYPEYIKLELKSEWQQMEDLKNLKRLIDKEYGQA